MDYDLSMLHSDRLTPMLARMDAWDREFAENPRGWR